MRFRLARAGGSGIFTEAALEKLYEYTQGVPRRLNAWCDLALVAGFAEGRQEIDGDFIDTVISAQGGSLEGLGAEEVLISEAQFASPRSLDFGSAASDNGLGATVTELATRLTRLEGLVLEMTSQLAPVITRVLSLATVPETSPPQDDQATPPSNDSAESLDPDDLPPPRKSRWFSFWKK